MFPHLELFINDMGYVCARRKHPELNKTSTPYPKHIIGFIIIILIISSAHSK